MATHNLQHIYCFLPLNDLLKMRHVSTDCLRALRTFRLRSLSLSPELLGEIDANGSFKELSQLIVRSLPTLERFVYRSNLAPEATQTATRLIRFNNEVQIAGAAAEDEQENVAEGQGVPQVYLAVSELKWIIEHMGRNICCIEVAAGFETMGWLSLPVAEEFGCSQSSNNATHCGFPELRHLVLSCTSCRMNDYITLEHSLTCLARSIIERRHEMGYIYSNPFLKLEIPGGSIELHKVIHTHPCTLTLSFVNRSESTETALENILRCSASLLDHNIRIHHIVGLRTLFQCFALIQCCKHFATSWQNGNHTVTSQEEIVAASRPYLHVFIGKFTALISTSSLTDAMSVMALILSDSSFSIESLNIRVTEPSTYHNHRQRSDELLPDYDTLGSREGHIAKISLSMQRIANTDNFPAIDACVRHWFDSTFYTGSWAPQYLATRLLSTP